MKVAVLPLSAAAGTRPALGRQFANFAAETVRTATSAEIHSVSYLARVDDENRAAFVNVAETLMEPEWIQQLFTQSDADRVMDGLVAYDEDAGTFELSFRAHERGNDQALFLHEWKFPKAEIFAHLHTMVKDLASTCEVELPEELAGDAMEFGTDDPDAFIRFLEGYDALLYIQQAEGRVAREFSPEPAFESLLASLKTDPDFLGPYETLLQLARLSVQFRIGTFELVEKYLLAVIELAPDDFRAYYAMGEGFEAVGHSAKAGEWFEKALAREPNEPAIYTHLGMAQMAQGMPVNAERNFQKAVEMEGEDKPSLDYLATVLHQTNRAHEVPALWKQQIERQPQNAMVHAKYGISLMQAGREEEAIAAFEEGLRVLEDPLSLKRFYAPILANRGELDRAMDFFEDCIDVAPNDIPLLLEYAQTLKQAGREFEIPKILADVLASNPDADTRAQTLAWQIELEQPKRAEVVEAAREKMEQGDAESAVATLKPLRNWLADYWKMWALLGAAHNRLGEYEDAEFAARRLIELFPGCEPAYGELAAALTGLDKHEEAYEAMRFAAGRLPNSLGIHVNLALAAKRAGRKDEATSLAKQIREAVGPNEELEKVLAEIER
ncbi:MAG: hypothetical protein M9921_01690 [Fimbriimonadaceae bacterium]|nr:tetratricopeptide repeat protein [Chthonomonadaceae bacterium]MCO5295548.1 hypothetical protein [Fimbriimonadaceae bacterium]